MENFLLWLGANAVKGSVVTLIVFFIILFFSRKIPPRYSYKLWYLAAIRFVMLPIFFASFSFFALAPSFIPENLPVTEEFNTKQETNMYPASSVSNYSEPEKTWTSLIQENTSEILFAVWAIGALGLILLFILRNIRGHSLTKGLEPLEDEKMNAFIDECRKLVKVNRKFTLHETELTGSPVLLGVFKPKLLIPKKLFNKLKAQELRYVILHELMHLKKNDILINWFFGIVCALQWFNPFTWYAFTRMKSDREEARDADVLALLNKNESKEYGGLILKLSTLCSPGASFSESVGIMEKNKKIKRRIIMIKNFRTMSFWNTLLAVVLIAGVGISCLSEAQSNKAEMQDKFAAIKIKRIDFLMTNIKSVVGRLHSVFLQHYPESKVKFILDMDKKKQLKLLGNGLDMEGASFESVLDRVCVMFSLQYRIEKNAVVFYAVNIESLTKALNDKDSKVRRHAARALGYLNDNRTFELLIKALKDKDSIVRRNAAGSLGNLYDKRAFEPLIKALKDKNRNVRMSAVSALGSMKDKRTVEPLIKALKDKDKDVRENAASALGYMNDKRAIAPLIKALKDKDKGMRICAASALVRLKDKRAIAPLIKALKDKDSYVRENAASALGGLKDKRAFDPLIKALKDKNVRRHAASALGRLKDKRAVEPLIKLLKDKDSSVRSSAAYALGELGDKRAVEPLIKALKDKDSYVRRYAAYVLGGLKDKRAIEPLIKVLNDKDKDMRISTVSALGCLKDKRAFTPLVKLLKDEDIRVRSYATHALGTLGDKRAFELLIKLLKDKNSDVRGGAAHALGKLGDKRAVDPLFKALKDKNSDVRRNAAYALGYLKNKRGIKPLKDLLKAEKNPYIIEHIKNLLNNMDSGH